MPHVAREPDLPAKVHAPIEAFVLESETRLSFKPASEPQQHGMRNNAVTLIAGCYVRLLRDEVLAEWQLDGPSPTPHVHCHVSGQER